MTSCCEITVLEILVTTADRKWFSRFCLFHLWHCDPFVSVQKVWNTAICCKCEWLSCRNTDKYEPLKLEEKTEYNSQDMSRTVNGLRFEAKRNIRTWFQWKSFIDSLKWRVPEGHWILKLDIQLCLGLVSSNCKTLTQLYFIIPYIFKTNKFH